MSSPDYRFDQTTSEYAVILAKCFHALSFPEQYPTITATIPDIPELRSMGYEVGSQIKRVEADVLTPGLNSKEISANLQRRYFPIGKFIATNNLVLDGHIIRKSIELSYIRSGLEINYESFLPGPSIFESIQHTSGTTQGRINNKKSQPLIEFVKQKLLA